MKKKNNIKIVKDTDTKIIIKKQDIVITFT
jgi:hypothetical protein